MADNRKYLLIVRDTTPAFDPSVLYTGTWRQTTTNNKFNVDDIAVRTGRFTPEKLGSTRGMARIVRAYCNGPVIDGDELRVLSSSDPLRGGLPASVLRQPPVALGTSLEEARPLLIGPTDDLGVAFVGDGDAASVNFVVDDLSAEEWALIQAAILGGQAQGAATAGTFESRTVAANAVLAAWTGTLFVRATSLASNGTVTLPPLANVPVGARLVLFRAPISNGRWFSVVRDGADTINGSTFPIRMTHETQGVIIEATAGGWVTDASPAEASALVVTGSAILNPPFQLVTSVLWDIAADAALTLPLAANVAVDQVFEVSLRSRSGGNGGYVQPQTGEVFDGVVDSRVALVSPGDHARVRRVPGGWASLTNGGELDRDMQIVTANPSLGASTGWRGNRAFRANYAAPGDFTLPTAPISGTRITVASGTANAVTLQAGANTIVASGAAGNSLLLAINVPVSLQYFTGGFWLRVG